MNVDVKNDFDIILHYTYIQRSMSYKSEINCLLKVKSAFLRNLGPSSWTEVIFCMVNWRQHAS